MRRFALSAWLTVVASTILYAGACTTTPPATSQGAGGSAVTLPDEVIYEAGATDEALLELLAKDPTDVASERLVFDTPAAGSTLSVDTPPTFSWHFGPSASLAPPSRERGRDAEPSPTERGAFWGPLRELVGPMRAAEAHGDPVNGRGTLLSFRSGDTVLFVVFTMATTYTPSAAAWQALVDEGGAIEVATLSADFDDNLILAGNGPFTGDSLTLSFE